MWLMLADDHLKRQAQYPYGISVTETSSGSSVTPSEPTTQEPNDASTPHQLVITVCMYLAIYVEYSVLYISCQSVSWVLALSD